MPKGGTRKNPASETLKVWEARLSYAEQIAPRATSKSLRLTIFLSVFAGSLIKLPAFLPINGNWYYSRFSPLVVLGALSIYFLSRPKAPSAKYVFIIGFAVCLSALMSLPEAPKSASITMALIHMPLVLGSILALIYLGNEWKISESRLGFIRYVGETLILTVLVLCGGVVLVAMTFGLFSLIGVPLGDWYLNYVVVFGVAAAPIVATFLYDSVLGRESRLASIIANVFSPLFLITSAAYLAAIVHQGKTPYSDRDSLVIINGLLLLVWAMTVFSVSGKATSHSRRILDIVNISLISITLVINLAALSAILYRWATYGLTPNRVAVTGANILIFVHLTWILKSYVLHLRSMRSLDQLKDAVAQFLPMYSVWSAFVVFALPALFSYK